MSNFIRIRRYEREGTKTVERVEVFNFSEKSTPVRVQVINGEPWFVAKDVCDILGIKNNRDAIRRLDDDEKATSVLPTQFGDKEMWLVCESGLYALVLQSRKVEARRFRKWVTSEVLPSIREHGCYGAEGGTVRRCGVEGMLYRGVRLYPYRELLGALGMSVRSGSACRRRRMWPAYFVRAFGRDFVTEQLADLLEEERRVERRREAMRRWQLELEFK